MGWQLAFVILVCGSLSTLVHGHSGGLDSNGCHSGSQPYHCHRAPSNMAGNRLRCDLGSRSADCGSADEAQSSYPADQNPQHVDVVARALLDAAEREPDPDIRKQLLDEYRRLVELD
jgi:hypothetical protein